MKNDWEETRVCVQSVSITIKDEKNQINIKKQDWELIKNFIDQEINKNG